MKKKLLAVAVVGALASPVAFGQTLYGIVDVGYQNVDNDADDVNQDFVVSGQHSSSRLGVRGSEDLAGGTYAMYQIEFDIQGDTGATAAAGITHRLTMVGLGNKAWGELTLGRQYTHVFHTRVLGLSAGTSTFGSAYGQQPGTTRASNSVKYSSPNMGGFSVGAIWAPGLADQNGGEATATGDDHNYWDAAIRWTPGPFGAAAAYGVETEEFTGGEIEVTYTTLSGYWDNRAFGVYANYTLAEEEETGVTPSAELTYMSISGVARFGGNNEVHVSFGEVEAEGTGLATDPTATFWGVSFVHRMSKRTLVYAGYGSTDNDEGIGLKHVGMAPSVSSTTPGGATIAGFQVGLAHSF